MNIYTLVLLYLSLVMFLVLQPLDSTIAQLTRELELKGDLLSAKEAESIALHQQFDALRKENQTLRLNMPKRHPKTTQLIPNQDQRIRSRTADDIANDE